MARWIWTGCVAGSRRCSRGGTSGIRRIATGRVRDHADAMQIVSGPVGRDVARYEALPSAQVVAHMDRFLAWFERTRPTGGAIAAATVNGIARAALVHLWFESIHLVEDGNGRPGRALADMALAQNLHAQDPHRPARPWCGMPRIRRSAGGGRPKVNPMNANARCWRACWKQGMWARAAALCEQPAPKP